MMENETREFKKSINGGNYELQSNKNWRNQENKSI